MKQDLTFGMILGPPSVRKISAMLLQSIYSTFEGVFFYTFFGKTNSKLCFLYIVVSTLKARFFEQCAKSRKMATFDV